MVNPNQGLDATGLECQVGQVRPALEVVGECRVRVVSEHHPHPILRVALEEANCKQQFAKPAEEPVHQRLVQDSH